MREINYWQIAAGDRGRDYSEFFLRHGVATVGGDPHVQIMKGVKCGDVVILKKGTSHLLAAGKVITRGDVHASATDEEKAQYKHWFEDFDGWEQPAFCHVEWHKPSEPIQLSGLRRGTIQRVHSRTVQELAESVILSEPAVPTSPLPEPVPLISNEAFISFLVEQGHRPSDAENLTDTLRRIRLLVDYYHRLKSAESKFAVTEDETRAFLILPFLLGIGWAEQQLKLELQVSKRGRVDIAGFSSPYVGRNDECVLIVEAKGLFTGLDFSFKQAEAYASKFPNCKVIVTSNGYCYKTYHRLANQQAFSNKPSAYLNLLSPTDKYHVDPEVDGALDVLEWLLPMNLTRKLIHQLKQEANTSWHA